MYKIYFINHMYYAGIEFEHLEDAIWYAKGTGYECRIEKDKEPICSYSPITGLRYF